MLDLGVTELQVIHTRNMDDAWAAAYLDNQLRKLEQLWRVAFIARGHILLEMEERMLWKNLEDPATGYPYTSMGTWICDAAPQSRSDAYAALRAVKELRDIPREHLEGVQRCNIAILQSLSTAVRSEPEVLEWARDKSEKDFVKELQKKHPQQWVESKRRIQFNMASSALIVVEQGIAAAMEREGLATREQVLEMWACNDLELHMEAENDL